MADLNFTYFIGDHLEIANTSCFNYDDVCVLNGQHTISELTLCTSQKINMISVIPIASMISAGRIFV